MARRARVTLERGSVSYHTALPIGRPAEESLSTFIETCSTDSSGHGHLWTPRQHSPMTRTSSMKRDSAQLVSGPPVEPPSRCRDDRSETSSDGSWEAVDRASGFLLVDCTTLLKYAFRIALACVGFLAVLGTVFVLGVEYDRSLQRGHLDHVLTARAKLLQKHYRCLSTVFVQTHEAEHLDLASLDLSQAHGNGSGGTCSANSTGYAYHIYHSVPLASPAELTRAVVDGVHPDPPSYPWASQTVQRQCSGCETFPNRIAFADPDTSTGRTEEAAEDEDPEATENPTLKENIFLLPPDQMQVLCVGGRRLPGCKQPEASEEETGPGSRPFPGPSFPDPVTTDATTRDVLH